MAAKSDDAMDVDARDEIGRNDDAGEEDGVEKEPEDIVEQEVSNGLLFGETFKFDGACYL